MLHVVYCLLRVRAFEDSVSCHKHIGSSLIKQRCVLQVHTTVDLNEALGILAATKSTQLSHLVVGVFYKLLTTKTWIDTHKQNYIAFLHYVFKQADRSVGIKHNTGFHTGTMNCMNSTVEVCTSLIMNGEYISSRILEVIDVPVWIHNHQMHVKRFLRMLFDMFDYRLAKRYIGHEDAVHNVNMQPITLALVEHLYVAPQIAKIGTEQ